MEIWEQVAAELQVTVQVEQMEETTSQICAELGPKWLQAAILPVLIAHPRSQVKFFCRIAQTEPMHQLNGGLYDVTSNELAGAAGIITIIPRDLPPKNVDFAVSRYLILPALELWRGQTKSTFLKPKSKLRTLIGQAYLQGLGRFPKLVDQLRTAQQLRQEKRVSLLPNQGTNKYTAVTKLDQPVMWIAMHWLENGGAEAWALAQLKLAREAGFHTIVTVDEVAPQRNFAQVAQLADEVLLVAQSLGEYDWTAFALNLVQSRKVTWIHIHHSALAYTNLHTLKSFKPSLRVEDTTHILEYRDGGYVEATARWSPAIDLHHVISEQLADRLSAAGIPGERIVYRPLTGMQTEGTKPIKPAEPTKPTKPTEPTKPTKLTKPTEPEQLPAASPLKTADRKLKVGFLGRFALQKRPWLFLRLAADIERKMPGSFQFIMQGSGELAEQVHQYRSRLGLTERVLEMRPWGDPAEFFQEIDILLICSENEGLTLTTLEADRYGVLVLSAQVGSQYSVIAQACLLPRQPGTFVKQARKLIELIIADQRLYQKWLGQQQRKIQALRNLESASEYFTKHYNQAMKS